MRILAVAALVTLDVSAASAQSTRHFKDSWFWGLKGGGMFYQVQSAPNSLTPLAGVDWLITRTNGGLYVSLDHSFFKRDSVFLNDSISPLDTVPRTVILGGMRRLTIAGMIFPMQTYRFHPYFGLGVSLSHIVKADPLGTFRNGVQQTLVLNTVQSFRTAASPVFILGGQLRLLKVSAFGQVSATPAYRNFFLFTRGAWRTTVEGGLRFNVGSSIEPMR